MNWQTLAHMLTARRTNAGLSFDYRTAGCNPPFPPVRLRPAYPERRVLTAFVSVPKVIPALGRTELWVIAFIAARVVD